MPDHDGNSWIERGLEQIEVPSYGDAPLPDYGTTLLENSQHHLSGGRKVYHGGVMMLSTYKGPTVNIRMPKWVDNVIWIRAKTYEAAQWIADAVFYYSGRPPFHFRRNFNYPPLLLGTGELLNTREKCSVHVAKIAKGPTLLSERGVYKERVKKLVLETVQHPDIVQFLDGVRADRRKAVEVDALSEEALRLLAPDLVHVDAATMLRAADTSTFGSDVNLSTAYVPSFGIDEPENILLSVGQNIGYAYHRNASNLPTSLDEGSQHVGEEAVPRSSGEYVEWLERNGGLVHELMTIPTASYKDKAKEIERSARILTALAEELTYLRPGNTSRLGYDINMREWRVYWNELMSEMKTVDPHTSSLGVYVLTTWPYPDFLRTLALRLSMLHAADTSTFGSDVNLSTAYVPSFGIENILLSVGQNIGCAYHRNASNLPTSLDEGSQHVGEEAVPRSSGEYVEWLERNGGLVHELMTIPTASCKDNLAKEIETSARILTALAGELSYLRPGNRSRLRYDINMREWRVYWNELMSEMKTVDPHTSSLGVYVLTTWPYPDFLRTLALRLSM